jgi:hypothetical protein
MCGSNICILTLGEFMDKVDEKEKSVAVIMPMFNAEKTIIRAIESVCYKHILIGICIL